MDTPRRGAKTRTIKRVLQAKVADWIDSVDDSALAQQLAKDTIVTGGSIASLLLGEPINDFDVYFRSTETAERVAQYYVAEFLAERPGYSPEPVVRRDTIENIKGEEEERIVIWVQSAGAAGASEESSEYEYFEMTDNLDGDGALNWIENITEDLLTAESPETKKYRPVFLSQNAISLSDKMQLVIRFCGSPDEIHDNYDFVHAMNYYDYGENKLVLRSEALESLLSRALLYKGSLYPIASLFRTKKFIERGWRITAGEMLKIAWQISELDLNNFTVLREQLIGVDAAYFHEILAILAAEKEARNERGETKDINATYVATIIDRVFNL